MQTAQQVLDRTRPVREKKGSNPCRYEVVIYHREIDWEQETGSVVARFAYKGDAFLWAQRIGGVHTVVIRN